MISFSSIYDDVKDEKICTTCKVIKPLDHFNFKNIAKNKRSNKCKECCVEERILYRDNGGREINSLRSRRNTEYRRRVWYRWKYTQSCAICGENHPDVLDLHHVDPYKKEYEVTDLWRRSIASLEILKKEVEKCVVLCANCHRKVHSSINTLILPDNIPLAVFPMPNKAILKKIRDEVWEEIVDTRKEIQESKGNDHGKKVSDDGSFEPFIDWNDLLHYIPCDSDT